MIIQIPRGTSIVLRLDGPDAGDSEPGETITLLAGSGPGLSDKAAPGRLASPARGVRRRTMLACGAAGMVVAAVGVTLLNPSPRAEPTLNLPHATAWNDSRPVMPDRVRAELARGPTVIPHDAAPSPPPAGQPAGTPSSNPFGLD